MPVIEIEFDELKKLSGIHREIEWFENAIAMTGASFEGISGNVMRFEFFPNRPDHYSVEGIARTLKMLYGVTDGWKLTLHPAPYTVIEGEAVRKIRPVICCAVVRGLKMEDSTIRSLIALQEKLHSTVGRKRRKVAIGLHDMKDVTFPLTYDAYPSGEMEFVPLGSEESMSLKRIMSEHEKGREYASLIEGDLCPLIIDSGGNVLSMPPIINSSMTRINRDTSDLFIDVTGTSFYACSGVLNILSAALSDRGGKVHSVEMRFRGKRVTTPSSEGRKLRISIPSLRRMLGIPMDRDELAGLLQRMGYAIKGEGKSLAVSAPPFRMDLLHPVDVFEDAAIAYGFSRFGSSLSEEYTPGTELHVSSLRDSIAEIMTGYGYSEVVTFMISSEARERAALLQDGGSVTILNPVSEEEGILRRSLVPGMLSLLEANRKNELPQRIFEVGDVHTPVKRTFFAALSIHPKASFSEAKSLADALARDFRLDWSYERCLDGRFIEGRVLQIMHSGIPSGFLGELSPSAIVNFNLYAPIAAVELDIKAAGMLR